MTILDAPYRPGDPGGVNEAFWVCEAEDAVFCLHFWMDGPEPKTMEQYLQSVRHMQAWAREHSEGRWMHSEVVRDVGQYPFTDAANMTFVGEGVVPYAVRFYVERYLKENQCR